jgi:hypothetical protein
LTPPTLQIQYCYSLIHSRKYLGQPYCLQTSVFGVGIPSGLLTADLTALDSQ